MAQITPEEHMMLLNRAWHEGIDKKTTESFIHKHMNGALQAVRIIKNDDYIKGFEAAMIFVEDLLKNTATYEEVAQMMEYEHGRKRKDNPTDS